MSITENKRCKIIDALMRCRQDVGDAIDNSECVKECSHGDVLGLIYTTGKAVDHALDTVLKELDND